MEQRVIYPQKYEEILLTDDIRDWTVCQEVRFRYEIGEEKAIKSILLAPSDSYNGMLVIDGNHRVISIGELGREIRSYVVSSNADREEIQRMAEKGLIATGGVSLGDFVTGVTRFDELIEEAEDFYRRNEELSLRRYLDQVK